MRVAARVSLTDKEREALQRLLEDGAAPARVTQRARIVLMAAGGARNKEIAAALGIGRAQAARWRERYLQGGLNGLLHEGPRGAVVDADGHAAAQPAPAQVPHALQGPRGVRHLVRRDALMKRLLEARRRRCVVVQAPAASGKTSLLAEWRKDLVALGYETCWLSLTGLGDEPSRCFDGLLASLAQVDPLAAREAAQVCGSWDDEAVLESRVVALVRGLRRRARELVLILDDLHQATDRRVLQILQWLLDYAPASVHLALASRKAPQLSLERLDLRGELARFDLRDLRWTAEESEQLLCEQMGAVPPRDAARWHALADGWVGGLQMLAAGLRQVRAGALSLAAVMDGPAVAAWFEREVLPAWEPRDLELLERMAACRRFCATLCAEVQGAPEAAADLRARLDRLAQDGLFLQPVATQGGEPWYRLHPMLRETLLARSAAGAGQAELHARAWRWFERNGWLDEAVCHAVRAGDLGAAAEMVEGCAQDLLNAGELNRVAALLRALPAGAVEGRFGLQVVTAYMQLYARDVDALRASIERVQALPADELRRYTLCLLRSGLAMQLDDIDTADSVLPQLMAVPLEAGALARNRSTNMVAWMLAARGEFDRARQFLEQAPPCIGAPLSGQIGRCIEAMSLARTGQLREAVRIAREVLEGCESHGAAYLGLACMAAAQLADTLYELDEPEAAARLLEPRMAVLERVSLPETVLRAYTVLANVHALAGRGVQALECIGQLEAYARRWGLARLQAEALALRLRRHLREGRTERAWAALQAIDTLAREAVGAGGRARIAQVAERARMEVALHMQDFGAAAAALHRQLPATALPLARAGLHLLMAVAQLGLRCEEPARRELLAAVRIGHRLGLARTLLDALDLAPPGFDPLARLPVDDPVLGFYVEGLQDAAERGTRTARGTGNPGLEQVMVTLSDREREILGLVSQTMSNKKIATALNVSSETVKWHLKNIYAKLGVWGRGGAAARLRDLSLTAEAHPS